MYVSEGCVLVFVCLPRVRRRLCVICVCILFVDLSFSGSIYTSENKGSVYSNSEFHLVDALSQRHTWTGVVSYKTYASAPTSFFFKSVMAAGVGRRGGCRTLGGFYGLRDSYSTGVLFFYSLHCRKTISSASSGECFVQDGCSLCGRLALLLSSRIRGACFSSTDCNSVIQRGEVINIK